MFYGWYVVAVCFAAALFTWGLGVFGASVYLAELTGAGAWSLPVVSSAVTVFYLTNALVLPLTGRAIDRRGPQSVIALGALLLGSGVFALGWIESSWQLYLAFVFMGLGYSTMSVTGLSATIAPWFERHQGRSVALALTGASFGAMLGVPLLAGAVDWLGFRNATALAGLVFAAVMVPLAIIVLRFRSPGEIGLSRDGGPGNPHPRGDPDGNPDGNPDGGPGGSPGGTIGDDSGPNGLPDRPDPAPLRSLALWSVAIAFALGLVVQIGFLTHHVALAAPTLGPSGAAWLVSATGLTGLLGRLWLARIADRMPLRPYSAGLFAIQALAFLALASSSAVPVLVTASVVYGFCLGQITTLSPIVVRREFGAANFGAIYGVAGTVIQFCSAFGPVLFGLLHGLSGGYAPVLAIAAGFEAAAMVVILLGWRRA